MQANQEMDIKFGDWLSEGFKMFTDNWQTWCVISLLAMLITFASALCFGIGLFFVTGPIIHSLFYICFKQMRGEVIAAGDVMYGFKNRFWDFCKPMICISLIALACYGIIFLVFMGSALLAEQLNMPALAIMGGLIFFLFIVAFLIVVVYLSPRLCFMFPLMVAKGLGPKAAFDEANRVVKQKFWWLLLYTFVANLISSLGTYACYIGLIATYPLFFTMIAAAYRGIWEASSTPAPIISQDIDPDKTMLG